MSSNVYTSTPKPVLRKSTSQALLSSKISIPRVLSYQCDECGHRMLRVSSYQKAYGNEALNSYRLSRPHSLYSDQDYSSQKMSNYNSQQKLIHTKNEFPRNLRKQENSYEHIDNEDHMNTMDVRIRVTADIMRDSYNFSESAHDISEKTNNKFDESSEETASIVKDKSDIFVKAKIFKKKCLTRLCSLTQH
eukprot:TRINITY_DN18612_c0_g1_i1.p1 TRINITY_DN18612_c0_g1~~TRINITY_DN18612_c0_g1_i1.p1  ORF type:complete len:191 (-),score=30.45 TRINITY_DN18612_c0_g1_i1:72-644(-)